jgi:hypothetical protein
MTSRPLQIVYYLIGIKSLVLAVKIANADIFVVTKISLNGIQKFFAAIIKDLILIIKIVKTARGTVVHVHSYCFPSRRKQLVRKTPSC